jgi:threonyl-tRNA synthetase
MTDSLGRSWQMGTIQLDALMPQRFGVTYVGPDNREHTPYMIHRASFGSLERFIGILIEHYAGDFPFWLAPVQVRVILVAEPQRQDATIVLDRLREAGVRAELDDTSESVSKKIRNAEIEKIPITVLVGKREKLDSLTVRKRGGEQRTLALEELIADLGTL